MGWYSISKCTLLKLGYGDRRLFGQPRLTCLFESVDRLSSGSQDSSQFERTNHLTSDQPYSQPRFDAEAYAHGRAYATRKFDNFT